MRGVTQPASKSAEGVLYVRWDKGCNSLLCVSKLSDSLTCQDVRGVTQPASNSADGVLDVRWDKGCCYLQVG